MGILGENSTVKSLELLFGWAGKTLPSKSGCSHKKEAGRQKGPPASQKL